MTGVRYPLLPSIPRQVARYPLLPPREALNAPPLPPARLWNAPPCPRRGVLLSASVLVLAATDRAPPPRGPLSRGSCWMRSEDRREPVVLASEVFDASPSSATRPARS